MTLNLHNLFYSHTITTMGRNASVNSTCAKPPHPLPAGGIVFFFCLGWQIPGGGALELSNPPGWGRKKRASAPSSVNTATFFIDRTVE